MIDLPPLTVFDLETTGLDPKKGHRIIEIAAVRIENGIILKDSPFVSFVNPEREIPWEARQVNKIADEDVKNAPTIEEVLPKFLAFAQGSVLIAHNADFDYSFLQNEKEFCWGYVELPECLCTLKLAQSLYPKDFRHSLNLLCHKFNLIYPDGRHRALADTILLSEALLKMIDDGKIMTMEGLRKRASLKELAGKK